jgi:hypothetical protein
LIVVDKPLSTISGRNVNISVNQSDSCESRESSDCGKIIWVTNELRIIEPGTQSVEILIFVFVD